MKSYSFSPALIASAVIITALAGCTASPAMQHDKSKSSMPMHMSDKDKMNMYDCGMNMKEMSPEMRQQHMEMMNKRMTPEMKQKHMEMMRRHHPEMMQEKTAPQPSSK